MRFLLLLLLPGIVFANNYETIGNIDYTHDTDTNTTLRMSIGAAWIENLWNLGISEGQIRIRDLTQKRTLHNVNGLFSRKHGSMMFSGALGVVYNAEWNFITTEMVVSHWWEQWYIETGFSRNFIDTVPGINNRITYNNFSFSADHTKNDVTIVGALNYTNFSDGNIRNTLITRYIYAPEDLHGLSLQMKFRHTQSKFNPVEYFSPKIWDQALFGIGFNKKVDIKWKLRGHFLVGPQYIDHDQTSFSEARIELSGRIKQCKVELYHTRATTSPGYQWAQYGITASYRF